MTGRRSSRPAVVTSPIVAARRGGAPRRRSRRACALALAAASGSRRVVRASRPVDGEQHVAGVVGDLERHRAPTSPAARRLRAARCAVVSRASSRPPPAPRRRARRRRRVVLEDRRRARRSRPGAGHARSPARCRREPGQAAQRHVEDVVGLDLAAGRTPSSAAGAPAAASSQVRMIAMTSSMSTMAIEQAVDQVQPVLALAPAELAAPAHHLEAVVDVDLQQLAGARACAAGPRRAPRC